MSLKEIRERHEVVNNTIVMMARQNGKTLLTRANQDRGELLELIDELKNDLLILNDAYDETIIKRILSKLD